MVTVRGPLTVSHVVVVIPAHNEEGLLPRCLRAVAIASRQCDAIVDVVVVADDCDDGTGEVARVDGVCVVEIAARNVGAARAAGVAAWRSGHVAEPTESTWIATTDADSRVPPRWLSAQLAAAAAGAAAAVGMVRVTDWEDRHTDVAREWQSRHLAVPGHSHVHGANLGVRLSSLDAAGGFLPLATGEDVDLVARLAAHGARLVRTATAPVATSARREARAPAGFATYLDSLEAALAV
ncbi:MAG: glycosyltransferase [Actinomycetes bacterium]